MDAIFYIQIVSEISIYFMLLTIALNFYIYFNPFVKNKMENYIISGLFAIITILAYAYFQNYNTRFIYGGVMLFVCIILFAFERKNLKQKIYLCLCFYVMRFLMSGIMAELSFYTRDLPVVSKILQHSVLADMLYLIIDRILYVGLSFALFYLGIRLFHKAYRYKQEELTWNEFIFLCIPQLTIIFVNHIVLKYFNLFSEGISNGSIKQNIPADSYRFLFYVTAYVMLLLLMVTYQKMKENQRKRYQTELIETQIQQMKKHLEQVELLYKETQSLRHDMGNHLQIMEHLIHDCNMKEAGEYLARLKEQQTVISPVVKTGNPITDIILQEKRREAEDRRIDFSCNYRFPSQNNIDAFDMSIILSNLLDNCLEAVNGENSWIHIDSEQIGDIYILRISNSFTGNLNMDIETGLPVSSKGEGHGVGLHNVKGVMKKYNGDIVFEQEADCVLVSIIIPLHP